jgi:hypothetical protein
MTFATALSGADNDWMLARLAGPPAEGDTAVGLVPYGVPFDIETPSGLRTAYPLKKMETVEVVRRGIQYELPRLPPRRAHGPGNAPG